MKRFLKSFNSKFIISSILLIVIIFFSFQAVNNFSDREEDRSNAIRDVILKAAIQCYALEGSYPPSIDYLSENYGIIIDEEQYYYFYDTNGANIPPSIEVIKR